MSKGKLYVDRVYCKSQAAKGPTLLKFQNGNLTAISKEATKFCSVRSTTKRSIGAVVVSNSNIYHGIKTDEVSEEFIDTYMCVKNRNTNKVRIIPLDRVLLNNQIYNSLDESRTARLSKENSQQMLLKQFGGRKTSRYIANAEKMKMNMDVMKDELDSTILEASFNEEKYNVNSEQYIDGIRPKFNKEAVKLNEVYDVGDLISNELLERLDEEAKAVYSTIAENLPIESEFLKSCIRDIQNSTPSARNMLNIKIVLYMDGLRNLMKTRLRRLDKVELSKITEKVENDIRNRFADPYSGKSKMRTKFSNEKGLCYFIVLALLINDKYETDLNVLTQELCIPKTKIVKFAQIANAKKKSNSDILTLCLPSNIHLPTAKSRKTRK